MSYDLGILNGRIVDGSGNPWYYGDIGIVGKKIERIGRVGRAECRRAIDARNLYVCPGFIDIHTHSDLTPFDHPGCDSTLRQGVTTHLNGNCGDSPAPLKGPGAAAWRKHTRMRDEWDWTSFGEYLRALESLRLGHHIGTLVGHNTVRAMAMGWQRREPNAKELRFMKDLVEQSMLDGAFGLSTGLVYPVGCFAKTDEIVELCKVVARYGGMYASHIRGERETIMKAIKEAIEIGRRSGARVQISHNCPKQGASGRTKESLGLVEKARGEGLEVTIDNDVHTDFGPTLGHALPPYLHELDKAELARLLADPKVRAKVRKEMIDDKLPAPGYGGLYKHGLFNRIFILYAPGLKGLEGKTLAQLAKARRKDSWDVYFDLIIESKDTIVTLCDYIEEKDIRALMVHPLMMFSSDCAACALTGSEKDRAEYSPCSYGEYPGIFERYVRDEPVLSIQEAVRKMTSFPAQKIGLYDRGLLRPGMVADIAAIDLSRIKDNATNLWPHKYPFVNFPPRYPEGIPYVVVAGQLAVDRGRQTKVRAGEVLRQKAP
ncbi:MAG TPA: D-aminoacylase [Thermoplasmata archaeon]